MKFNLDDEERFEIGDDDEIYRVVPISKKYKAGKIYSLESIPKQKGKMKRRGLGPIGGMAEYE